MYTVYTVHCVDSTKHGTGGMFITVYTQTSAFSYSLFYLHNQINNYKQTTKSTVCVNCDYATGYNTAVIQFCSNKFVKFLGKSWHITEQFYDFTQP